MFRNIVKIVVYFDGYYYLVLVVIGEVYFWGCGDGGWLGYGDIVFLEEFKVIFVFFGK